MGRIGQAVMERLKAFQVAKFVYSGRTKKENGWFSHSEVSLSWSDRAML